MIPISPEEFNGLSLEELVARVFLEVHAKELANCATKADVRRVFGFSEIEWVPEWSKEGF